MYKILVKFNIKEFESTLNQAASNGWKIVNIGWPTAQQPHYYVLLVKA